MRIDEDSQNIIRPSSRTTPWALYSYPVVHLFAHASVCGQVCTTTQPRACHGTHSTRRMLAVSLHRILVTLVLRYTCLLRSRCHVSLLSNLPRAVCLGLTELASPFPSTGRIAALFVVLGLSFTPYYVPWPFRLAHRASSRGRLVGACHGDLSRCPRDAAVATPTPGSNLWASWYEHQAARRESLNTL